MLDVVLICALASLAQQTPQAELRSPATWIEFYQETAREYHITRSPGGDELQLRDRAIFDWSSLDDYHGGVFAWVDRGRPAVIATIFSFPMKGSPQRLAVHEFASFSETAIA